MGHCTQLIQTTASRAGNINMAVFSEIKERLWVGRKVRMEDGSITNNVK
jgi:hypothetical protein